MSASNWIKMRTSLRTSPKIVTLASRLSVTNVTALGCVCHAWMIADEHADDEGRIEFMTAEALDGLIGVPGLADAMVAVGWLEVFDDYLQFPEYKEHNGSTGKSRALSAKRQHKKRNGKSVTSVTVKRDASVTRGEEIRGEKKRTPTPQTPLAPSRGSKPSAVPAPAAPVGGQDDAGASGGGGGENNFGEGEQGGHGAEVRAVLVGAGVSSPAALDRLAALEGLTVARAKAVIRGWQDDRRSGQALGVGVLVSRLEVQAEMPVGQGPEEVVDRAANAAKVTAQKLEAERSQAERDLAARKDRLAQLEALPETQQLDLERRALKLMVPWFAEAQKALGWRKSQFLQSGMARLLEEHSGALEAAHG